MAFEESLRELLECWKSSPEPSLKITTYFPVYARLFEHLRGTDCVFIETGVLDGGSLFMWRAFLGPRARIVGVDLNPAAARWRDAGFEIEIGDQGDPLFWRELLARVGAFDVLLDDGGHQSFQQIVTVEEALRVAKKSCLIVVEDTATSFMTDFRRHGAHSFLSYCKAATDCLVARQFGTFENRFPRSRNQASLDLFQHVFGIQFFNGIVAFQVDPARCGLPEVVRNHGAGKADDFRYEGKSEAQVEWPDPFDKRLVRVEGGRARTRLVPLFLQALAEPRKAFRRIFG